MTECILLYGLLVRFIEHSGTKLSFHGYYSVLALNRPFSDTRRTRLQFLIRCSSPISLGEHLLIPVHPSSPVQPPLPSI